MNFLRCSLMFNIPFYTSNGEFNEHDELQQSLLERREEFCVDSNRFYGTGYSTIHSNDKLDQ